MRSAWFHCLGTLLISTSVLGFSKEIGVHWSSSNGLRTSSSTVGRRSNWERQRSTTSTTAIRMEALETIGKILQDTFRFPPRNKGNDSTSNDFQQKRNDLKQELLRICRPLPNSSSKTTLREKVEEIIQNLSPLSPVTNTAKSPLLCKEWILVWTTEKEINFFQDLNLSQYITQTISYTSPNDGKLENLIQFVNGGFLSVEGDLSVDDDRRDDSGTSTKSVHQRTNFQFTSAKLNFGWGGRTFTIPPVGKGWFDTLYLDDDFRIDVNSRDDILICTSSTKG